jgi:hypothetical protein
MLLACIFGGIVLVLLLLFAFSIAAVAGQADKDMGLK